MLVVGSRIDVVSDWNVGARFPQRIVQVDIDPLVVGQRRPVEVGIVGDAALGARCAGCAARRWPGAARAGSTPRASAAASRPQMVERAGPVLKVDRGSARSAAGRHHLRGRSDLGRLLDAAAAADLPAAHADPSRDVRDARLLAAGGDRREARLPEAAGGVDLRRRRLSLHDAGAGDGAAPRTWT